MKKIIGSIFVIYMFLFFLELSFNYFKKNHLVEYEINNILIKEDYRGNTKNEENNYYLELKTNENTFLIQTYENFKKEKRIIKEIKHFKNNKYECLLPIFKNNKIITDLICIENDIQKNYSTFKDDKIDEFLEHTSYNKENYKDKQGRLIIKGTTTFYVNNIPENNYLAFNYNKGLKIADKTSLTEIELFKNKIYNQKINAFNNNKYFIIDYNIQNTTNNFILIDMKTKEKTKIQSNEKISFNSYIQGSLNNAIYLFDKNNKNQYQIDLEGKTITRIGNSTSGIKYYNGTWQNIKTEEAVKEEKIFKDYEQTNEYIMIKKIRGNEYGTTIYVKENNNKYDVYESYRNNQKLIYLFTTTNYKTINFIKENIYYQDGIYIKVYSNKTGSKTLIEDTEIKNPTIYVGEI